MKIPTASSEFSNLFDFKFLRIILYQPYQWWKVDVSFWVNIFNTAIEIRKHVFINPPLLAGNRQLKQWGAINILCTSTESVTLQLCTLKNMNKIFRKIKSKTRIIGQNKCFDRRKSTIYSLPILHTINYFKTLDYNSKKRIYREFQILCMTIIWMWGIDPCLNQRQYFHKIRLHFLLGAIFSQKELK